MSVGEVLISCCASEGARFDLEAEFGDLGGQTLGFDLRGATVEVVGAEILVVGAVITRQDTVPKVSSREGRPRPGGKLTSEEAQPRP